MKTAFIIFMISITSISMMCGQLDKQWSIKNRQGISGIANGIPNYFTTGSNSTLNGPTYCFGGFKHPIMPYLNTADNTFVTPKNDIFVIYDDGKFFNSYTQNNWFQASNTTSLKDYQLTRTHQSPINYLYWTNRYEGDDINSISVAEPPTNPTTGTPCNYQETINVGVNTDATYFNVNHDIVGNRDITLIVKAQNTDCNNYTLNFNNCPGTVCTDLLTYYPTIFSSSISIADNIEISSARSLSLNFNSAGIAYANFRVKEFTYPYYVNSKKHQFSISAVSKSEECKRMPATVFSPLDVSINASHDPNYMQLMSICPDGDASNNTGYMFNFYAQVQNTGSATASNVKLEIPIPVMYDINKIYVNKIYFNGEDFSPTEFENSRFEINQASRKFIIEFFPNSDLNIFNPNNVFESVAAVDFCIKGTNNNSNYPNNDSFNHNTVIFPDSAQTTFGGKNFTLNTFIDLDKRKITPTCQCTLTYKVSSCSSICCRIRRLFCRD